MLTMLISFIAFTGTVGLLTWLLKLFGPASAAKATLISSFIILIIGYFCPVGKILQAVTFILPTTYMFIIFSVEFFFIPCL